LRAGDGALTAELAGWRATGQHQGTLVTSDRRLLAAPARRVLRIERFSTPPPSVQAEPTVLLADLRCSARDLYRCGGGGW